MAYTLATAVTEVRALINEATASYWTDSELQEWIKQGCLDWCEKTLLLTKDDTITLATDTYSYTTSGSSYIDSAHMVTYAEYNNVALQRVSQEQMRGHNAMKLASDPAPKYYTETWDGTDLAVLIGPTPSATYNGQTVTVEFAMVTDDITELPYQFQQHVFLYAASKAKNKERQYGEARLWWQQYQNNVSFARRDSAEHGQKPTDDFRIR